jgi:glycosyltransferase involved in cell wall biosynthesis
MSTPRISVIIPAHNAERWLQNTIASVLQQRMQDLEVIVVNDGSTDGTGRLARAFQDPRVVVVDQANRGVSAARNTGIAHARGEYLTFLDADDAMLPENLELKLEALGKHGVDWVFGDLVLCDSELHPSGSLLRGTDGDVVRTILLGTDPAVPALCSNALMHRRCFATLRFDEELSNAADQHMALLLAMHFSHRHVPFATTLYRVLPDSMSRNIALYERDHLRLLAKAKELGLLQDAAFSRRCMANAYWSIAGSWWRNAGSPARALPFLLRAAWLRPALLLRPFRRR